MFGIYRFTLSIMVVIAHLAGPVINWTGVYAVFCFYLLSGYLMTLVLNHRYGFDLKGLGRYALNRILRIYPPYLVLLLMAILIVCLIPEAAKELNESFSMPKHPIHWMHNLLIFGLNGDSNRLIPPAWSIDVELFFYCVMALILVRSRIICVSWFLFSLGYTVFMVSTGKDFGFRYMSYIGASLPFSLGAVIYFYRKHLPILTPIHGMFSITLFLLYACLAKFLWANPRDMGFYIALALGLYIQVYLLNLKKSGLPPWLIKLDKHLGDLSYPIFLCHWQVGAIIVFASPFGVSERGINLLLLGFFPIIFMAFVINRIIEKPVETLRDIIRNTASR